MITSSNSTNINNNLIADTSSSSSSSTSAAMYSSASIPISALSATSSNAGYCLSSSSSSATAGPFLTTNLLNLTPIAPYPAVCNYALYKPMVSVLTSSNLPLNLPSFSTSQPAQGSLVHQASTLISNPYVKSRFLGKNWPTTKRNEAKTFDTMSSDCCAAQSTSKTDALNPDTTTTTATKLPDNYVSSIINDFRFPLSGTPWLDSTSAFSLNTKNKFKKRHRTRRAGDLTLFPGQFQPNHNHNRMLPKNPLMLLHELKPDVEYRFVSQTGPTHRPEFTMCVNIDEHKFEGTGRTKKLARIQAAQRAVDFMLANPEHIKKPSRSQCQKPENNSINNSASTSDNCSNQHENLPNLNDSHSNDKSS